MPAVAMIEPYEILLDDERFSNLQMPFCASSASPETKLNSFVEIS
jgi:hypothetical protein